MTEYFVHVCNPDDEIEGAHNTYGYLNAETGVYRSMPGITPGSNKEYRAHELPDDAVMLVGHDHGGRVRSVQERKLIAAIAEGHGYRIRRGAPAMLPQDERPAGPPMGEVRSYSGYVQSMEYDPDPFSP